MWQVISMGRLVKWQSRVPLHMKKASPDGSFVADSESPVATFLCLNPQRAANCSSVNLQPMLHWGWSVVTCFTPFTLLISNLWAHIVLVQIMTSVEILVPIIVILFLVLFDGQDYFWGGWRMGGLCLRRQNCLRSLGFIYCCVVRISRSQDIEGYRRIYKLSIHMRIFVDWQLHKNVCCLTTLIKITSSLNFLINFDQWIRHCVEHLKLVQHIGMRLQGHSGCATNKAESESIDRHYLLRTTRWRMLGSSPPPPPTHFHPVGLTSVWIGKPPTLQFQWTLKWWKKCDKMLTNWSSIHYLFFLR